MTKIDHNKVEKIVRELSKDLPLCALLSHTYHQNRLEYLRSVYDCEPLEARLAAMEAIGKYRSRLNSRRSNHA